MVCSIFLEVCCDPQYQMPSKSQQKTYNYDYQTELERVNKLLFSWNV